MIFEEALKAMRDGKKIRNPRFSDGEYLMACYTVNKHNLDNYPKQPQIHTFKMKKSDIHPNIDPDYDSLLMSKHCFSSITVWDLMHDDWEILNDI